LNEFAPPRQLRRWAARGDMVRLLVLLVAVLFLLSTVTLTIIQTRLIRQFGWRVFRERSMTTLYWRDLSWQQRLLLWPGIVAFFVVLFAGLIWR
jgi:hypothetical protein